MEQQQNKTKQNNQYYNQYYNLLYFAFLLVLQQPIQGCNC